MTNREITRIIAGGIERAAQVGYTKPQDIAIAIQVDLATAGLKIVRKPSPRVRVS